MLHSWKIIKIAYVLTAGIFVKHDAPHYDIKFGVMKLDVNGDCTLDTETRIIPFKLRDTGFRWGYTIESPVDVFSTYSLAYSPEPFEEVAGVLQIINQEKDVLKTPTVQVDGGFYSACFSHDPLDPIGSQQMVIYINGQIAQKIDFEILKP